MASIEKLIKSFEALKVLQAPIDKPEEPLFSTKFIKKETVLSRRDKINHCSNISEIICSPQLRNIKDFQKFLGAAIETLLVCCDDNDSDVRYNANQCLNKVINALIDCQLSRIHAELYKEIKKNGSSRSIRAALSRFADLSHLTRPSKCKAFFTYILPCIITISKRTEEEIIQETLEMSIKKIMPVFGRYANNSETMNLLDCFLLNLNHSFSFVRRTAATALVVIAHNSKRPVYFYSLLIRSLLKLYHKSLQENSEINTNNTLAGLFLCLKNLFPYIREITFKDDFGIGLKQKEESIQLIDNLREDILQCYELMLFSLRYSNDNIVLLNGLESIQQFLKTPPKLIESLLLEQTELKSRMSNVITSIPSSPLISKKVTSAESSCDVASLVDDDDIIKNLSLSAHLLGESKNSINLSFRSDSETDLSLSNTNVACSMDHFELLESCEKEKATSEVSEMYNEVSIVSESRVGNNQPISVEGIGEYTSNCIPIEYCVRLICGRFLLTGVPGELVPDHLIRVSIKSIAIGCIGSIVKLHPKAFNLSLKVDESSSSQSISDISLYHKDNDPNLKGQLAIVLGTYLASVYNSSSEIISKEKKWLDLMMEMLNGCPITVRSVLTGIGLFINDMGIEVLGILKKLVKFKDHSYCLVKVELCSILGRLPYVIIRYMENELISKGFQQLVIQIILQFLGDPDHKVRSAAALCLVNIVPNLFLQTSETNGDPVIRLASLYTHQNIPLLSQNYEKDPPQISENISFVVSTVKDYLTSHIEKKPLFGCFEALGELNKAYPVRKWAKAWGVEKDKSCDTISFIELLLYSLDNWCDLSILHHVIKLIGDLVEGLSLYCECPEELFCSVSMSIMRFIAIFGLVMQEKGINLPKKKGEEKEKKLIKNSLLADKNLVEMHDIINSSWTSGKISLGENEKPIRVLRSLLNVMRTLLEIGNFNFFSKYAEELLEYLTNVIIYEAESSIRVVRGLLRCLFGINSRETKESSKNQMPVFGLYQAIIARPCAAFSEHCASNDNAQKIVETEKIEKKLIDVSPASYIKFFKPLVIKALTLYTMSSNSGLQVEVLGFICELIRLTVNYCQLDANCIFLNYVLKQFDYLDGGWLSKELVGSILEFLVLLSYLFKDDPSQNSVSKSNDNVLVSVGKIIQMIDDLIASEVEGKVVCAALKPLVEDLFLVRIVGRGDAVKELEAQREVIIATLLKMAGVTEALELLVIVIKVSKREGEDKWRRCSRQVIDVLLPLLEKQGVNIQDVKSLNLLHAIFESVSSAVFRPVDYLLKGLFAKMLDVRRYMCCVLVLLRVLVIQAKEEVVLARLEDLKPELDWMGWEIPDDQSVTLFSVFLLGIVEIGMKEVVLKKVKKESEFACQQLGCLLLCLTHMFQSGCYRKVAKRTSELGRIGSKVLNLINQYTIEIRTIHPTLVLQWCNILMLLSYDDMGTHQFWYDLLKVENDEANIRHGGIEIELLRRGTLILMCDFFCENGNDVEQLTWLIINNISNIIRWCRDLPVRDFIEAVHRNSASSELFLQAVVAKWKDWSNPVMMEKLLDTVQIAHKSQISLLISLLVENVLSNDTRGLEAIRKRVNNIINEKFELIKGENDLEDLNSKLKSSNKSNFLMNENKKVKVDREWLVKFITNYCGHHNHLDLFAEMGEEIWSGKNGMRVLSRCIEKGLGLAVGLQHGMSLMKYLPNGLFKSDVDLITGDNETVNVGDEFSKKSSDFLGDKSDSDNSFLQTSSLDYKESFKNKTSSAKVFHSDRDFESKNDIVSSKSADKKLDSKVNLENKINSIPEIEDVVDDPLRSPMKFFVSNEHFITNKSSDKDSDGKLLLSDISSTTLTSGISSPCLSPVKKLSQLHSKVENISIFSDEFNKKLRSKSIESTAKFVMPKYLSVLNDVDIKDRLLKSLTMPFVSLLHSYSSVYISICKYIRKNEVPLKEEYMGMLAKLGCVYAALVLKENNEKCCGCNGNDECSGYNGLEVLEQVALLGENVLGLSGASVVISAIYHLVEKESVIPLVCPLPSSFYIGSRPPHITSLVGQLTSLVYQIYLSTNRKKDFNANSLYTSPSNPFNSWPTKSLFNKFDSNLLVGSSAHFALNSDNSFTSHLSNHLASPNSFSANASPSHLSKPLSSVISSSNSWLLFSPIKTVISSTDQHKRNESPILNSTQTDNYSCLVDIFKLGIPSYSFSLSSPSPLYNIIISIARYPSLHTLCLLPVSKWLPTFSGEYNLNCAIVPAEYLLTENVLEEVIWRVDSLGWGERRVFEEIWMSLLGVVKEGCIVGGVKGLSMLVEKGIQNKKKKSKTIESQKSDTLQLRKFDRIPKGGETKKLAKQRLSQVFDEIREEKQETNEWFDADVDMDSCVRFLMDLYGQLIANDLPSTMVLEIYKSLYILSYYFEDKCQWDWYLNLLLNIPYDDIPIPYIPLGLCKCVHKLGILIECEMEDKAIKLLEACLKSSYLPTRIGVLRGIIWIERMYDVAKDYILRHLSDNSLPSSHNEEHVILMWSISFHLLLLSKSNSNQNSFNQKLLQLALKVLKDNNGNYLVHGCVCFGLCELLINDVLDEKDGEIIFKTAMESFKSSNQLEAMQTLMLIVTEIYILGLSNAPVDMEEDILLGMEKVGVLFDRMKCCTGLEREKIAKMLPQILVDFFPIQHVMNKIIGHFLSNHQFYPKSSAYILYKVFGKLHECGRVDVIHEWVILSLSSFIQIKPLSHAIWSLNCFLISASSNKYIRKLFYCVQNRMGILESKDEELFIYCCTNFYDELNSMEKKSNLLCIFGKVSETYSIYAEVVCYLKNKSKSIF